jgi:predicted RNA-binding Zn ribbon-like protein
MQGYEGGVRGRLASEKSRPRRQIAKRTLGDRLQVTSCSAEMYVEVQPSERVRCCSSKEGAGGWQRLRETDRVWRRQAKCGLRRRAAVVV